MTVPELCDVAYSLLIEQLERYTFPDSDRARADFDKALLAEPEQVHVDPERRDLMAALGLGVR